MKIFFNDRDNTNTITILIRAEGNGNLVGDLRDDLPPGAELFGVSYDQMKARGTGVINVNADGKGVIESA